MFSSLSSEMAMEVGSEVEFIVKTESAKREQWWLSLLSDEGDSTEWNGELMRRTLGRVVTGHAFLKSALVARYWKWLMKSVSGRTSRYIDKDEPQCSKRFGQTFFLKKYRWKVEVPAMEPIRGVERAAGH